jgi:hypothetical protein
MANEILGAKSYLTLETESTWGTTPDSEWVHLPVMDYGVKFVPERRNATPMLGVRQRKHGKNYRGMPSGSLQTSLFGAVDAGPGISLAEYLTTWAFASPESVDLPSKSAIWAEGPDVANKIHKGLRVNQATMSGSDDTGFIQVDLELMGKTEANHATAETLPDDREKIQEFEFFDATLSIFGGAVAFKSFQWQVQNNLEVNYLNSFNPSLLTAGQRIESLNVVLIKNADTYDAYRRLSTVTETTATLVLRGLHNGTGATGTHTVLTITFNRLSYVNHDDQRGISQLTKIPLQFDLLKPDSASNAVTLAYSEA